MLAGKVLQRAASAPTEADVRSLAGRALAEPREDMTPEQIRAVMADAVAQSRQVADLFERLAGLVGTGGTDEEPR